MSRVKLGQIAWGRWFDMATWTAIEAAKLTICGKKACFSPNMCKMSDFNCRIYTLDSARNLNTMIERAMQAGELSRHNTLSPYEYIRWASTKSSIALPQEMIDWYNTQSNNKSAFLSLESQLAEKDARIAELEAKLAAASQWSAETATLTPKGKRTAAATEKRATHELTKWKEQYAPAMVKVALCCGKEGSKKRQANTFRKMFKDEGVTLSNNMLTIFRGWLSDEHTDKTGGAPSQG